MSDREPTDLSTLFAMISATRPASAWPPLSKCQGLAALVLAQRPKVVIEIGVWTGDSIVPMLLALKYLGNGKAFAIDPWDATASTEGQTEIDAAWWGKAPHDKALDQFQKRLQQLEVDQICGILRKRSDDVDPTIFGPIGLAHVDGNHADQAVRDVTRYAPHIELGGYLVLDDLEWVGGAVRRAREVALGLGFVERYMLGSGPVLQRVAMSAGATA